MKKAQGISLTTIVIASLSLIVLVVLVLIFTGRMSLFGLGMDTTEKDCANLCKGGGYAQGGSVKDATCSLGETEQSFPKVVCCCKAS